MVLAFSVAACNNDKTGKNQNSTNREKDDYSKNNSGDNNDEKKDEVKTGDNENAVNKTMRGWPQSERDGFMSSCEKNAMAGGTINKELAESYCACMLKKMEILYPDIEEAAKLTNEDLETPAMKRMAADCLKQD